MNKGESIIAQRGIDRRPQVIRRVELVPEPDDLPARVDQVDLRGGAEAERLDHRRVIGVEDIDLHKGHPVAVLPLQPIHDGMHLAAGRSHGGVELDHLDLARLRRG